MDIFKQKSDVFSQIAALRVSAEGFPKSSTINSIKSISQKTNSLNFLIDLCKALIGFEALRDSLIDLLTHNIDDIELDIKQAIKKLLKSLISCDINPSLPDSFIVDGITVELNKIDFLDIFKVNPNTTSGKLLYSDITSFLESTDFNTFLYNVIQNNGEEGFWGHSTIDSDILKINFNATSPLPNQPNNTITIKPSNTYSSKKLTDLNNDYIDSIKLFDTNKLINSIIESIFGSISLNISKDKSALNNELKIKDIIDRIINSDEDVVIDDSYFSFTNEEIHDIEYRSELRRKGVDIINTDKEIESSVNMETLTTLNDELLNLNSNTITPELIEIKSNIVRDGLNKLSDDITNNVNNQDKLNVKINFIENMLRNLMNSIVNVLLSPKLIIIFSLNHYIIHGESFNNIEDFMKKNKTLLTTILETVRDIVVSILLNRILKEIKILVADNIIKTQIERNKSRRAQLASLTGTPTEVLRQISGLI